MSCAFGINLLYLHRVMGEKGNVRKEKLADLFFNMANTAFGASVIGVLVSFAMGLEEKLVMNVVVLLIAGCVTTILLACIGFEILKDKEDE